VIDDARARVHLDGCAGRVGRHITRARAIAAPIADISAVITDPEDSVRSYSDGDVLFNNSADVVEQLN
jgi:hypothetical protein